MASCLSIETSDNQSVGMGQIALACKPACLRAVLGSCVGVALHHPRLHVGVLGHVVLPKRNGQTASPGKFADSAVPHMLQMLAKLGAPHSAVVAKIAGGACMFGIGGPLQIGDANIKAVTEALEAAGVRVAARDVGGTTGRRMSLDCSTGSVTIESVGNSIRTI
jgi:chemotaxis protein CheD